MKKEDKNNKSKSSIISAILSLTLLTAIAVCFICDIAISGGLTWSLITAGSIFFVWIITYPVIIMGRRGIAASLLALSFFIIPYIFLLSRLLGVEEVFYIGAVMSVISIAFIWIVFLVFEKSRKSRGFLALGI